jgi:hypothetical protein
MTPSSQPSTDRLAGRRSTDRRSVAAKCSTLGWPRFRRVASYLLPAALGAVANLRPDCGRGVHRRRRRRPHQRRRRQRLHRADRPRVRRGRPGPGSSRVRRQPGRWYGRVRLRVGPLRLSGLLAVRILRASSSGGRTGLRGSPRSTSEPTVHVAQRAARVPGAVPGPGGLPRARFASNADNRPPSVPAADGHALSDSAPQPCGSRSTAQSPRQTRPPSSCSPPAPTLRARWLRKSLVDRLEV